MSYFMISTLYSLMKTYSEDNIKYIQERQVLCYPICNSDQFPLPSCCLLEHRFSSTVCIFVPFQTCHCRKSDLTSQTEKLYRTLTNVCENEGWQKMPVGRKQTRKIFCDFSSRVPDIQRTKIFRKRKGVFTWQFCFKGKETISK